LNFPYFIAKRYLVSKKSSNAINIISGISIGGICIGTLALVIVLSAFNGISDLVQSLYNSFDPDIKITVKHGKTFDPSSPEISELKKIKGVAFYTEVVEGNALLKFEDKQCVATIKGVSKEYESMSRFDTLIQEGKFNLAKNNIIIGKGIGYVLNTGPQELFTPISVFAPKRGITNSVNPEEALNELKVYPSGAFTINDEFDYNYALMNIDKARSLFDYTTEVTSIELGIKKDADREKVQLEIEKTLGEKYEVKNREQQNALLYKTLKSEKLWVFAILVFILIIATFNIIGCLTMLIIEKKKDITIMHYMGADINLIRKIFLVEGILITILGALSGLILGTFICWLQIKFSFVKFNEGFAAEAFPISFNVSDYLWITLAVLSIGFIASWYPVRVFTRKHLAV
jgi:lipoprotein-releasing system permease protein